VLKPGPQPPEEDRKLEVGGCGGTCLAACVTGGGTRGEELVVEQEPKDDGISLVMQILFFIVST